MSSPALFKSKPSFGGIVASHVFVFVFCVLLPAGFTAMAPVSWITLERRGDAVSARAETCVFFVFPYKTTDVPALTGVDTHVKTGSVTRERRRGRPDEHRQADDEGFLTLSGEQVSVDVSVSPASLTGVKKRVQAFVADPSRGRERFAVAANWKFGVFCGALASLLTVVWVFGVSAALVKAVLQGVRRGLRRLAGARAVAVPN